MLPLIGARPPPPLLLPKLRELAAVRFLGGVRLQLHKR
jgi:hypothetical protein